MFDVVSNARSINLIRMRFSNLTFTRDILCQEFKKYGIPSNSTFYADICKSEIIIRIEKGLYRFNDPNKPIHLEKVKDLFDKYHKRKNLYQKTWYNKRKEVDITERPDIKAAIELLKQNGFEISIKL